MLLMMWNIERFTYNKFEKPGRSAVIMENLDPINGGVGDTPAIIGVVEIYDSKAKLGELVAGQGAGGTYLLWQELYKQVSKSWRVVPPLCLSYSATGRGRSEGVAVYYDSSKVNFLGPNVWTEFGSVIPGNGVTPVDYSQPWKDPIVFGQQTAGRLRYFFNDGREINFPDFAFRRPWFTRFQEVNAPNRIFDLFFYHSTPDDFSNHILGTQGLGQIPDITGATNPAVVCGDFNVDANTPTDFNSGYGPLMTAGYVPLIPAGNAPSTTIRRTSYASPTNYQTGNSYDNLLVKNLGNGPWTVRVIDVVAGAPTPYEEAMEESLQNIATNYMGDAAQTNAFRQYVNYAHIRRTSDHVALAVNL